MFLRVGLVGYPADSGPPFSLLRVPPPSLDRVAGNADIQESADGIPHAIEGGMPQWQPEIFAAPAPLCRLWLDGQDQAHLCRRFVGAAEPFHGGRVARIPAVIPAAQVLAGFTVRGIFDDSLVRG